MSNSHAQPETLNEYLAHLPMTDEQRAELAGCKSFSELHERLSSSTFDAPSEAAQASVGRRLTLNSAEELEEAEMLALDASGRVCLKATPPIRRTKVVPEPWRTNILVRGWRRLTGRTNPPAPKKDERVLPAARWRTVGSIRRYILLVLMLGQTIVAGWYMKGIMPYQGWSLVDFDEIRNQTLLQTATQVLHFANAQWRVRRPRPFVLVIEGEVGDEGTEPADYLHDTLLLPEWREAFYHLVDATGLQPVIAAEYDYTELPLALELLARGPFGKVVLKF